MENNLIQITGPVNLTLRYDALGRLERLIESGRDTRFLYDGAQVIGELDAATGAVRRRYVPGPGVNEVIAWYEGAGVSDRRFIYQDERGSVVAVANDAGSAIATFRYGPWGETSDTAFTRFGYTGAIRLPGTDLLHMRARVYAAGLARFLQPDPIGFASGQLNLYAYVGGDPINGVDPFGLAPCVTTTNLERGDTTSTCKERFKRGGNLVQSFSVSSLDQDYLLELQQAIAGFAAQLLEAALGSLNAIVQADPLEHVATCNSPVQDPRTATFNTAAEAALNAFKYGLMRAGTTAREIGAQIVRVSGGLFQAIRVTIGTARKVTVRFIKTSRTVAFFHSHPAGIGLANFRQSRVGEGEGGASDIGSLELLNNSLGFQVDALLVTPDGALLLFEPPSYDAAITLFPSGCAF